MVETTRLDTDVTNLREDAGVDEAVLFETDEPVTLIFGEIVNGNDVVTEAQHYAAISVNRELDEDEQAVHQQESLQFSSVLVAAEDGEASQEAVLNVREGDVDTALEAFEMVEEDGIIDMTISSTTDFEATEEGVVNLDEFATGEEE